MGFEDILAGATGRFPNGKLKEDDEGELAIKLFIDVTKNTAVLDFGKSVSWIAFTRKEIDQLIINLIRIRDKMKEMEISNG